jgi:predicted RNA polymerase sigma factor
LDQHLTAPQLDAQPSATLATEIADDELCMLFVCADPALPQTAQLVLSLKLLCGFSTQEIAARLFLSEANVHKTLARGRARLASAWEGSRLLDSPAVESLPARLPAVLQVIYLLFTEGYSSQKAEQVIRRELCEEAIRLAELLVRQPVGDTSESWALLALLHFHIGRFAARLGAEGELLMLDEQDRSLWDQRHLARGFECLWRSGKGRNCRRTLQRSEFWRDSLVRNRAVV